MGTTFVYTAPVIAAEPQRSASALAHDASTRTSRTLQMDKNTRTARERRLPSTAAPLDPIIPVPEWYGLNGFSRSTGERIIAAGEIDVIHLSKRLRGIRQSENERWRQTRTVRGGK